MVRLRSERWYASEGQRKSRMQVATRSTGARRLISLCFLLALVVLLMKKAADPIHVSRAFSALGVPLESADEPKTRVESGSELASVDDEAIVWQQTCDDMVPRLLEDLSDTQLRTLAANWYELDLSKLSGETQQLREELWQKSDSVLEQALVAVRGKPEMESWTAALERYKSQWEAFCGQWPPDDRFQPVFSGAVTSYLDQRLVDGLKDASPWMSKEHLAFWRLMQRCNLEGKVNPLDGPNSADLAVYPTLQLEAESQALKNNWIRFRGSVRLVEHVDRKSSQFGIDGYSLAWLRDTEGSAQPVAIYSTDDELASLQLDPEDAETFVDVELIGIVGKRLAYASQSGVQVAPTIFASEIRVKSPAETVNRSEVSSEKIWTDTSWALGIGVILAGLILVPIVTSFRRKQSKKRIPARIKTGLLIGFLGLSILQDLAVAQESAPAVPWATGASKEQLRHQMLTKSVQSIAEEGELSQWLDYLAGNNTDEFPDQILKYQFHLRKLDARQLRSWAGAEVVTGVRLEPFSVVGRVVMAMPVQLSDLQASWFKKREKDRLYRMLVLPDGEGHEKPIPFISESVPSIWLSSAQLSQPVHLSGARLVYEDGRSISGFAQSIEWTIRDANDSTLSPAIPLNYQCFGTLGWDLANFDLAAKNMQQPLQASESEPLLELLGAVQESGSQVFRESNIEPVRSPIAILAEPAAKIGMPIRWQVRLVNAAVVKVNVDEGQASSYYQFNGFVNIGNRQIRYQLASDGQGDEVVNFDREFPVTLLMKQPPKEWIPSKVQQGTELSWEVGKFVEVEGFFYRLWSYRSELLDSKKSNARQAAPLVLATSLELAPPPLRNNMSEIGWFGYALCVAILVILGAILYSVFQKDKRRKFAA